MTQETTTVEKKAWPVRVWRFYRDGFRSMTVGKTLWAIILVKLFIFFVVIKVLFFPNFLSSKASDDSGKAEYVRHQMTPK